MHLHAEGARTTLCGRRDRSGPAVPYRAAHLPIPPDVDVCPACLAVG